ncbi:MAG: 50S ribosomal protein L4 [Bacteroidota bacterium]
MEIEVYKTSGEKANRKVTLNDAIFCIEPNDHCIYLDVKQHMANKRQGTHKTKDRSELSGSTRKLKRQKGTGGARAGDINSPLLRGGGRVFGPDPRDYNFKLNKKVKVLARKSALAYKTKENRITILEDFNFEAPKTQELLGVLKNLEMVDKKTLLVLADINRNVYLSSRNLSQTRVVSASDVNTYDILNAHSLLIAESSIAKIEEILGKKE